MRCSSSRYAGRAARRRSVRGLLVQADSPRLRAQLVHRDARGDREHPRAQVPAVLEPVVGAKRAQERLLPRVLGALAEQSAQVPEDLVAVLEVEALEGRDRHASIMS